MLSVMFIVYSPRAASVPLVVAFGILILFLSRMISITRSANNYDYINRFVALPKAETEIV